MPDYKSLINARVQRASEQTDLRAMQRQAAQHETVEWDATRWVLLDEIAVDERIQVRVGGLDEDKVREYAVVMAEGGEFPPVVLFREGDVLYLADGFHRVAAARRAGLGEILAEIRPGGYAGAVEYAEEANLTHGFALSTRDKRNIFERRWRRGHEWRNLSDREIARVLGVTHPTIGAWRKKLEDGEAATGKFLPVGDTLRIGADGKVRDVSNIQAANEQRVKEKSSRPASKPAPHYVDDPEFDQTADWDEPETGVVYDFVARQVVWPEGRAHAAPSSGVERVSLALATLLLAVQEAAAAIAAIDQDRFTAGELRELEEAAAEVLRSLRGYRSARGQWVAGLLDLVDGLRRFAAQG